MRFNLELHVVEVSTRAAAAAREAAADDDDAEPVWLSDAELHALLAQPRILAALRRIASDAETLDEYEGDAVVMGVLHSVCSTHAKAVHEAVATLPQPMEGPPPPVAAAVD